MISYQGLITQLTSDKNSSPATTAAADSTAATANSTAADSAAKEGESKGESKENYRLWLRDSADDNKWDAVREDEMANRLDNYGLTSKNIILVEGRKPDGQWPRLLEVKDWRNFQVGDTIDARDTVGKWYESTVRNVREGEVFVHYHGWQDVRLFPLLFHFILGCCRSILSVLFVCVYVDLGRMAAQGLGSIGCKGNPQWRPWRSEEL